MGDGKVLYRKIFRIKSPVPALPRYFGFIHAKANSPSYYSKGVLRGAENHCIFHYTLNGRGSCYNEFGRYETMPGQGFLSIIHDPNSGYAYPDDGTEEWEFICFCFDSGNSIELFRELIREYGAVFTIDNQNPVLAEMMALAYDEDSRPHAPFDNSRLFYQLYGELVKSASGEQKSKNNTEFHPHVKATLSIVREEIEHDPSADQIAIRLGLSREYLSRLFKSETGRKLKDYIREERIIKACKLLKNSDLSISEIAESMSFSSCSNFVRYFHAAMKITPAVFRRSGTMPDLLTVVPAEYQS